MMRRLDLTAAALLLVGGALWLTVRGSIAQAALRSPQALALLGGVLVLSVGLGLLAWRVTRRPLLARGLAALPLVAAFGWSEVLPAVQGDVVVQDVSPLAVTAPLVPGPAALVPSQRPEPAPTTPVRTTPVPRATTPVPRAPLGSAAVTRTPSPGAASPTATWVPVVTAPVPSPTVAPAAVLLGSAPLRGIDHDASGTVQLLRGADGRLVVRFERFTVERGPDYRLYVVPRAGARSPGGGTSLGDLRATRGSLNVTVPTAFPGDGPVTVLVWCRAFAVPVASASLP